MPSLSSSNLHKYPLNLTVSNFVWKAPAKGSSKNPWAYPGYKISPNPDSYCGSTQFPGVFKKT